MTLEIGTRRGFLVGALALMAAPAIVRADSIMKVVPVDLYDTRCLVDYCIGTDEFLLRVDRCMTKLYRPQPRFDGRQSHLHVITEAQARKLGMPDFAFKMQPPDITQRHVDMNLSYDRVREVLGLS